MYFLSYDKSSVAVCAEDTCREGNKQLGGNKNRNFVVSFHPSVLSKAVNG